MADVHDVSFDGITSVGVIVGTGDCECRCAECAGVMLRRDAQERDSPVMNAEQVFHFLRRAIVAGVGDMTISSGGEPMLSPTCVTSVLSMSSIMPGLIATGLRGFERTSLYTNGMSLSYDRESFSQLLRVWRRMGLSRVLLTVHHYDDEENMSLFGVPWMASWRHAVTSLLGNFEVRLNLPLRAEHGIGSLDEFRKYVEEAANAGASSVSAWPLRDCDDDSKLSRLAPSTRDLDEISSAAGGLARENGIGVSVHWPARPSKGVLTLFQDGSVRRQWCA